MEKIKINYDLIRRIKESKTGIRLHKTKNKLIILSCAYQLFFIPEVANCIINPKNIKSLFWSLGYAFWILGTTFVVDYLNEKNNKHNNIVDAEADLQELVRKLVKKDVRTTLELLKESKVIDTHYKIDYKDGKLPMLKQKKYIRVPLSNGYEDGEVLLQEHNLGSKDYELSIYEPVKEYKRELIRFKV